MKELFAQNRHRIWNLGDSNGIRTHNHLVRKRTLNHLAKLTFFQEYVEIKLKIFFIIFQEFLEWQK